MINNGIAGADKLISDSIDLLSLGLGVSLSDKEIAHRNNSLLQNWHRTNYGIDSVSLTSSTYRIEPTGRVAGATMVGSLADVYSNEGNLGINVESKGGIIGYTNNQENGDIDEKNVKDAKFKDEIVNNEKFKQGASFINPSGFESYSINEEKHNSLYATSSINATETTKQVKGAYKYNGGNEDLISRVAVNNTDVNNDYIMFNENARGNLTNSSNLLVTDDTTRFMVDDSYSSSSLLLGEYEDTVKPKTLVMRTNELFRYGKIGSIVARFKTDNDFGATDWPTVKTAAHGMSRGRNLLKGSTENINGYNNPYCRVWTNHYQFSKHNNLIRPFIDGDDGIDSSELRRKLGGLNAHVKCGDKNEQLSKYSVLETNGHVKVTPYRDENGEYTGDDKNLKKYMFSIENLAWKGYTENLSDEQKGPNGGRIMWFPPYDLKFSEASTPNWNPYNFIGRGEPIFTYSNTNRSGSIEFSILADHPSVVDAFTNENKDATEENEQKILRFFAGCESDIIDEITPIKTRECITTETETKNEGDISNRDRTVEIPETIYVAFPVFFQNNFTGVNYINPDGHESCKFTYSKEDGINEESKSLPFNQYYHNSKILKSEIVTEPYFEGKSISDGEEILKENEWYTSEYAGKSSNIGVINTDAVEAAMRLEPRGAKERRWLEKGKDRLNYTEAAKIMNSSLEKELGSNELVYGKRHVYAQDAVRYSRERQGTNKNYYDCVTYGLNTKLFSEYYNSGAKTEPIKDNYDFCPEKDSNNYKRTIWAFQKAYDYIRTLTSNNDSAKLVSLEDILSINNLQELFEVIKKPYITSATTNNGDVVKVDWEITTQLAYATASKSGGNNKSLAYLRYLFMYEILKNHGIETTFKPEYLTGRNTTSKLDESIRQNEEKADEIIRSCTNGKPSEKVRRFAFIYIKLTPKIYCDDNNAVSILKLKEDNNTSEIIKGENEKSEYLICARNMDAKSEGPRKTIIKSDCKSVCEYPNGADMEYQYFKKIKTTDPVLFKNIVKKFQYFDPAFHSITPEGFNARLTFLQQCTRQGPTTSVSDSGVVSTIGAGSLAFGTPPYCIIRIGDFFNTKVIIESLQITYDGSGGIPWDLNPEGIGVQPMYAHVQMSVKFLGGSDIAAPISRLQNAVSSNYYANSSVYDNTALKDAKEQHDYDLARNKIHSKMHTFKKNK